MWFFVPRSVAIGQGAAGAGAALVAILVIVGILHALIVMAWAAMASAVVVIGLMIANASLRWDAGFRIKPLFQILLNGFVGMMATIWMLDLLLGTYFSVPSMIVTLDRLVCDPNCPAGSFGGGRMAVIQSPADYFEIFVAGAPGGWIRYVLQIIPGALVFGWVLGSGEPCAFQPAPARREALSAITEPSFKALSALPASRPGSGLVRLAAVTAASAAIAMGLALPLLLQLFVAWRNSVG